MAQGKTYGISFPFMDSIEGKYLELTEFAAEEIRADLIHLLLTRKGSRYFLPNFGTNLYQFIFQPMDGPTFSDIESEIRDSVETFMPLLQITDIKISPADNDPISTTTMNTLKNNEFTVVNHNVTDYTAKVRIDYVVSNDVFNPKDFIIINI